MLTGGRSLKKDGRHKACVLADIDLVGRLSSDYKVPLNVRAELRGGQRLFQAESLSGSHCK